MKKAIVYLIIAFYSIQVFSQSKHIDVLNAFDKWKTEQIKNGKYLDLKNCNVDYVLKHENGASQSLPDEMTITYLDINEDKIIDAIVELSPNACDGGNAFINTTYKFIVLSNKSGYRITDDKLFEKMESKIKFEDMDGGVNLSPKFLNNKFELSCEAIYYKADDGRCCPSGKKTVTVNIITQKVTINE
jgi:hypothetical protein